VRTRGRGTGDITGGDTDSKNAGLTKIMKVIFILS